MKAREGSRRFSDMKNNPAPGGSLAKINSAPSSSMLKINLAPTGVLQKNNSTSKGLKDLQFCTSMNKISYTGHTEVEVH